MKFGADLKNSIVPEWARGYIAYDALKARIKAMTAAEAAEKDALEEDFFAQLEEELEKVNRFYLEKIKEFDDALSKLDGRPRSSSGDAFGAGAGAGAETRASGMVGLHAQIGRPPE